ncbi:MAG: Ppx/GppA family phosphatase [Leptolyngbya sp. SIO4C1]|nr:Ppx/GppA family phosphatase [Leptolyngbya sp. SIO4C1]
MNTVTASVPAAASISENRDRILAAIDVGTNSIHMVVVKIQPALPAFTIIDREKDTVRLGNFCEKTDKLTEAAMQRGIDALKRCLQIAESLRADDVVAVATSAVREAKNGLAFLDRVQAEVGLTINLISGPEEARRIYLGVLSGMELKGQPHAILDIGGGSTELILGTGEIHRSLSSTKVGAVRLSARFVTTDPISREEFIRLQAYVRGMLEPPADELKQQLATGETLQMIGTSGTIETLAILCAVDDYGTVPDPLNGYRMSYKALSKWIERLRKMTYAERLALPEMSDRRAEIIVPGAVILQTAMQLLGAEAITICECALREGVVVNWMLTHGLIEDRMQYQQSVRDRSVMATAKKYQVDLAQSERIAAFAGALFDQTQNQLHTWGAIEREHLWAAAILHNCGHFISHSAHHKHSYYLIRNGELLGFTEPEVELIANIARYHRKSAPKKKHEPYRELDKLQRKQVEQLSAILRIAVALDRRGIGAVSRFESQVESGLLSLTIYPAHAEDSCDLELWNLDFKKACFEAAFGVRLVARLAER